MDFQNLKISIKICLILVVLSQNLTFGSHIWQKRVQISLLFWWFYPGQVNVTKYILVRFPITLLHIILTLSQRSQSHPSDQWLLKWWKWNNNVYNMGTNSEKHIYHLKMIVFNVFFIVFMGVEPTLIIKYGQIFNIV